MADHLSSRIDDAGRRDGPPQQMSGQPALTGRVPRDRDESALFRVKIKNAGSTAAVGYFLDQSAIQVADREQGDAS